MSLRLCVVLPVHNEADLLPARLDALCSYLESHEGEFEVVLAENGSRDASKDVALALCGRRGRVQVLSTTTDAAGLGCAYHMGIEAGLAGCAAHEDGWFLLSSAELPFGFTDLDQFWRWHATHPAGQIAIGSKAHPESHAPTGTRRRLASLGFLVLRWGLVGMRTRDSQGTVFVRAPLARRLAPHILARDYFYSTELIYWAEREGIAVAELPIVLEPAPRPSTVQLRRDARRMLTHLVRVRRNHGRIQ